ncbi:SDR family NAD(P)-dependent oxidoreductase [Amycolatopsis sp. NPDC003865]
MTGTSSGIGRATAVRLAERGHDVVAGVRKIADAPKHPRIRAAVLDVTDAARLSAVAKDIGPLRGLVNNAGVTFAAPVEHIPLDRLRAQLEVNVVGVVAVCQAFLPAVRVGRGRVVMISSSSGRVATGIAAVERARGGRRARQLPVAEPGEHRDRALTAKRPRPRYQVGADAHLLVALSRVLPARAMDTLLARSLDLPRRPAN